MRLHQGVDCGRKHAMSEEEHQPPTRLLCGMPSMARRVRQNRLLVTQQHMQATLAALSCRSMPLLSQHRFKALSEACTFPRLDPTTARLRHDGGDDRPRKFRRPHQPDR